jgi:menaquinone-dependent protoporphyrinogen oxidase
MTQHVLVAYATKRGSTGEVAEAIGAGLRDRGLDVDVRAAREVDDLAGYDAVVLGGALYTGRWHADARRFLRRHAGRLEPLPLAVFGMGPKTGEAHDLAEARGQLERSLARTPKVHPASIAIFGGVIDPARLRFPFNRMPASDARDWDAIDAWADAFADRLVVAAPTLA